MIIDRAFTVWPGRRLQIFWCYEWHPRLRVYLGSYRRWGFDVALFRRRFMIYSWSLASPAQP